MFARKSYSPLKDLEKPAYMKEGTTANFLLESDLGKYYKGEIYKSYGYGEFFSYKFQHNINGAPRTFCVTFRKKFYKYHIRLSLIEKKLDESGDTDNPKVICKTRHESLILDSKGDPGNPPIFSSITSGSNFEIENSSIIRNMEELDSEAVPKYISDTTQKIVENEDLGKLLVEHCDVVVDTSHSPPPTPHITSHSPPPTPPTTSSEPDSVYELPNGTIYIGKLKNGMFDGKGVYTWPNGDKYDGGFVAGKRHGKGVFTSADGDKYDGDWENDKRHGKGVLTFKNGNMYDGDWENGKRQGKGVSFTNGDTYEGKWENGNKHGKGVLTFANGDTYDGMWENGKPVKVVSEGGATRRHTRLSRRRKSVFKRKGKKSYRKKKYGKTKKSRRFRRSVRSRR
jgi:hypothetical protein